MKTSLSVIFIILIATSFVVMMQVKSGVQDLQAEANMLMAKKSSKAEDIRVLRAEKAYLARPEQLQMFAEATNLQPINPQQVVLLPREMQIAYGRGH
ncbi:MAG: hypothetical protein CMF62_12620 [Magnetococcales bacterium]|nr:hypothetical protein [Magnetococcales bacterium]|tara:strand:- start:136245 stop:136535 length:291 start_codon:yes stop_codon:yes gene_type:complete